MTPDTDPRPLAATHSDEPAATGPVRDVPGAQNGSQGCESDDWDCGSGRCDPNTGCPECNDDRDHWVRRS